MGRSDPFLEHIGRAFGKHGVLGIGAGIHSKFIEGYDQWRKCLESTTGGSVPANVTDEPRGVVSEWACASTEDCVAWAIKAACSMQSK